MQIISQIYIIVNNKLKVYIFSDIMKKNFKKQEFKLIFKEKNYDIMDHSAFGCLERA